MFDDLTTFIDDFSTVHLDDVRFRELINRAMDVLCMSDDECAILLDVSRPTINRWRHGRTNPHRLLRDPVRAILVKKARQCVKARQRRERSSSRRQAVENRAAPALGAQQVAAAGSLA